MDVSMEVNYARNILTSLLAPCYAFVTQSFLLPVKCDNEIDKDYYSVITEPICLHDIKSKMDDSVYQDIKEFVCDFRLLLFNCYRYYGCDSKMGKAGAKLESVFEQKLLQLPITVRSKTTMDAILMDENKEVTNNEAPVTRRRNADRSLNTDIRLAMPIKAMMDEMEKFGSISSMFSDYNDLQADPVSYLSVRLRKWEERRGNVQLLRTFDSWFSECTCEEDRNVLDNSCDFVEFVEFVRLGMYGLGLDRILGGEEKAEDAMGILYHNLYYAMLFPQSSKLLGAIVILITTNNKNRMVVCKGEIPSYERWNKVLSDRVEQLYEFWYRERQDTQETEEQDVLDKRHRLLVKRFSIEPRFFQILGEYRNVSCNETARSRSIMHKYQFHQLSILQRCHLLLSMCYMTIRLQDSVRSAIDRSIDWDDYRMEVLGRTSDEQYDYVRFPGLGEYADHFIYRIRVGTMELDKELGLYSVSDNTNNGNGKTKSRKSKKMELDRYRMPNWFIEENKKNKKKKSTISRKSTRDSMKKKEKISLLVKGTRSRPKSMNENDGESVNENGDIVDDVGESVDNIKNEGDRELAEKEDEGVREVGDDNEAGGDEKKRNAGSEDEVDDVEEEERKTGDGMECEKVEDTEDNDGVNDDFIASITEINKDELELVVNNLASCVELESNLINDTCGNELLIGQLRSVREYWEKMEGTLVERLNVSKLRLRKEVIGETKLRDENSGNTNEVINEESSKYYEGVGSDYGDEGDEDIYGDRGRRRTRKRKRSDDEGDEEYDVDGDDEDDDDDDDANSSIIDSIQSTALSRHQRYEARQSAREEQHIRSFQAPPSTSLQTLQAPPSKKQRVEITNGLHNNTEIINGGCDNDDLPGDGESRSTSSLPITTNSYKSSINNHNGFSTVATTTTLTTTSSSVAHSNSVTNSSLKVKRRVYRIKDDYFTDDLQPVSILDDGSVVNLPLETVTEERYDLARRMIEMYKTRLKVPPPPPPSTSSSTLPSSLDNSLPSNPTNSTGNNNARLPLTYST